MHPKSISSERLVLRALYEHDAEFILQLCNDPEFLQHIGDKQVRDIPSACAYLNNGPLASYQKHGFGLLCMTLASSGQAIGMCGILKRDELPDPDLGYALLPEYRAKGYVKEACQAVLEDAKSRLQLPRVLAIVSPQNPTSIGILERIGFQFVESRPLSVGQTLLYQIEFQ